jgi:hypothetical protein
MFISSFNFQINFLFSNDQTFHIIFASAMKRDYLVYPSMIRSQSGILWSYDNPDVVSTFDNSNPLNVSSNQCNNASICVWYVSPLQSLNDSSGTQYALLGEWNKWTAVSSQRFLSLVTDTNKNQATITVQGVSNETIPVVVFHSLLLSVIVNCSISIMTSEAHLVITPSNIVCSKINQINYGFEIFFSMNK